MNLAPIVLFVYDRIEQTRRTIESLQKNYESKKSELYIYSDNHKCDRSSRGVAEVRNFIERLSGFKKITIIKRDANYGLKLSIETGVFEVISKHGKAIVLEDDLLLSINFLQYMNEALDRYADEENIMGISGYVSPHRIKVESDCFFLPFISSWGWATWKRSWDLYQKFPNNYQEYLSSPESIKRFNLNGAIDYYSMLKNTLAGKTHSWAINWYFANFIRSGLTLYPRETLVENIGFDGTGVNCRFHSLKQQKINNSFSVKTYPRNIEILKNYEEYIRGIPKLKLSFKSILKRLINK